MCHRTLNVMLSLLLISVFGGGTFFSGLIDALPPDGGKNFRVSGTGKVQGDTTVLELRLEGDQLVNGRPQRLASLPALTLRLSDKNGKLQMNGRRVSAPLVSRGQQQPVVLTAYEDEIVRRHNHYRQIHASPPLRYSKELAAYAKIHANRLAMLGSLVHENRTALNARNQGENLGSRCSYLPINNAKEQRKSIRKIVKKWYNEVCNYNFETPSFKPDVGHFSQVDWSTTREIGVGVAFSKNKKGMNCVYVVGRYRPAGNIDTSKAFQRNVNKGMFNRMSYCQPQVLADENL